MILLNIALAVFSTILITYSTSRISSWRKRQKLLHLLSKKAHHSVDTSATEKSLSPITQKIEHVINKHPLGKKFTTWVSDAGASVGLTVGNLVLVTLGLQVLALNLAGLLHLPVLGCMVVALVSEIGIVFWVLKKGADSQTLEREFPMVLETMAKVYRLHPDLKESAQRVMNRVDDPRLKRVFSQTIQLSQGGLTTIEALEYSGKQLTYPPLQFMISVMKSRLKLGGNIPLFLEEMAKSLKRSRETERQIASTMFQNKVSALIVSILVPLIFTFSFLFSEQYRSIILSDKFARLVIVGALIWWGVGVIFISRVVKARL